MPPNDAAALGTSGGGGSGCDRLSGLPDRILLRVMWHLKAWDAVRTGMLSKRWRNLWKSAGHLDIRQPCVCYGGAPAQRKAREMAFSTFVQNLLLRRQPFVSLESLRLSWSHTNGSGDDTNYWVTYAVRHGAVEIELSGKHHESCPKPECMSFIESDNTIIRLKILKLIHVNLDDNALKHLSSRSTSLEEMEIKGCRIPLSSTIQSELLKRLTIINCQIYKGLSVYAPNLDLLQFSRNFGYVPWIQNLGLLAASNINSRAPKKDPECSSLGFCNIKILKLSRVKLNDLTLAQLYSRCTSLEALELKECSVVGKEIRSTSLRYLTMISCEFAIDSGVHLPNLISLCCIRPRRQVPQFLNMEFLVTATIALDDSCMPSDSQWTWDDVDKDECDHDGDFFAHYRTDNFDDQDEEDDSDHEGAYSGSENSNDNSDNETDDDKEYESNHDGTHSRSDNSVHNSDNKSSQSEYQFGSDYASSVESYIHSDGGDEKPDDSSDIESGHNDNIFAHSVAKDSDGNHGCSGPSDEDDYCTVGYDEIAESYNDDCGGMFGGAGMLHSLSNVTTMDLLAHSGEVLLMRESKSCTNFKNLKTLSLGEWCITPDLDVLASMLEHSPNLENLSLHLDMANKIRVGFDTKASSVTCNNLKKVEITCCKHDKMVHILPEFFLPKGIQHKNISVHWTACTCDVKGGKVYNAKRKAQTEGEKRPAKQMKADEAPADEGALM